MHAATTSYATPSRAPMHDYIAAYDIDDADYAAIYLMLLYDTHMFHTIADAIFRCWRLRCRYY